MSEHMFDSDATWAQQFDRAVRNAEARDKLELEVDFGPILNEKVFQGMQTGRLTSNQNPYEEVGKLAFISVDGRVNYCPQHDWRTDSNTPCYYCELDKQRALTASHTPKQKNVICQFCAAGFLRFWGDGPYTCKACLPTEQHIANMAAFNQELEN